MSAVAFDTLKLARRLEGVGFSRDQADGTAEALAETLTSEIATKRDLLDVKIELKGDIAQLKADLRGEIASLRSDTAKWVVSAVFINFLTMVGLAAAVWQFAHK